MSDQDQGGGPFYDNAQDAIAAAEQHQVDVASRRGTRLDEVPEPDAETVRANELAERARPLAEQNPRLAQAISLLDAGRPVVPLDDGGRPLYAVAPSRDLAVILDAWQAHPQAQAGTPCGQAFGQAYDLLGAALDEKGWEWLKEAAKVERLSRGERLKRRLTGGPPPTVAEQATAAGVPPSGDPAMQALARRERRAIDAAVRAERDQDDDEDHEAHDELRFQPPEVRGHAGAPLWLVELPSEPAAAPRPSASAEPFFGGAAGRRLAADRAADRAEVLTWLVWSWPQPEGGKAWTLPVGRQVRPGVGLLSAVPAEGAELKLDSTRWRVANNALSRPLPLPAWLAEAFGGKLRPAPAEEG